MASAALLKVFKKHIWYGRPMSSFSYETVVTSGLVIKWLVITIQLLFNRNSEGGKAHFSQHVCLSVPSKITISRSVVG